MKTIIPLIIIFGLVRLTDVTDLREKAFKEGVNPLLLSLLSAETEEAAHLEFAERINSLLLQDETNQKYLWLDLASKRTQYSFFTEKRGETVEENREHTNRRVSEHFTQLRVKFETEGSCPSVSNDSLSKIDLVLHSKVLELFNKFKEVRLKGLLYQMMPGGELKATKPVLVYNGDWEDVKEEILKNLDGYFKCLDSRRTGDKLTSPPLGFFAGIVNFLKRLFGFGQPREIKITEPSVVIEKVEKLTREYDEELRTYAESLQPVFDLIYNPTKELLLALRFEIYDSLSRFDPEHTSKWGSFNSRLFEFIVRLASSYQQSNDAKSVENLKLFYQMLSFFHKSFGKDYLSITPRMPVLSQLMILVEESLLQLALNIDASFSVSCARSFISAFKLGEDKQGLDHSNVEFMLKELTGPIQNQVPLINQYGLIVEVLQSTNAETVSDNLTLAASKIIDLLGETHQFDDHSVQLMSVSRILAGFPFGQSNEAVSLYMQISQLASNVLNSNEGMTEASDFSKIFDQELDKQLAESEDQLFAKHYPLLKIVNLWGSKGVLKGIQFGKVNKNWNERLDLIVGDNRRFYSEKLGVVLDIDGKLDFSSLSDRDILFEQVKDLYSVTVKNEKSADGNMVRI